LEGGKRVKTLVALALGAALSAHAAAFDVEGHRGARGLAPENTLAAFRTALALGVATIETDVAVTRDDVVVISHNPRLSADLTRDAGGRWLDREGPRIRDLSYAELARYDIGRLNPQSSYARQFPQQQASDGERFPKLEQLFDLVKDRDVRLNIETKLTPDHPEDAPAPDPFARLVVERVRAAGVASRVTIQSFDWRTLLAVKKLAPELRTSCLTIETNDSNNVAPRNGAPSAWTAGLDLRQEASVPRLAKAAGCDVWSPFFRNAMRERVDEAHALGLTVLPWTVNDTADIERLLDAGVDGLISDYPDRLKAIVEHRGLSAR
jgi:glycerophosphoryl diester phosphodiesterase